MCHIIKRKQHDDFELGMLTMDLGNFFATRYIDIAIDGAAVPRAARQVAVAQIRNGSLSTTHHRVSDVRKLCFFFLSAKSISFSHLYIWPKIFGKAEHLAFYVSFQ